MAKHERHVESQDRCEQLHGRADVRVLSHDQRPEFHVHAKPEPAESVQGKPNAERHRLLGTGDPELGGLRERGDQGPGAGG